MKYSVITKFNMQILTIKLQRHENIVENEVLWINSQRIPNLIPVQVNNNGKDNLLNYNVNGFISLKNYLKNKMIRSDVTVLLSSIVECCKSIEVNNLNFEKLLLEEKGIFINPVSKKCAFAYVPIDTYVNGLQKSIFLNKLVREIHLEKKENPEMILNFKNMISNPQFHWSELDDFVKHMADEDRKMIHINKSLQNKQVENNIKFCVKCGQQYVVGAKFCKKCGNPLITPESQNKDMAVQEISNQITTSQVNTASIPPQMDVQQYKTYEDLQFNPMGDESEELTTVLSSYVDESDDATTVLNMNKTPKVIYPYFVRERNGEEIHINKNNFNLGKGKSSDYIITGNSAISRIHAMIITRENKYYIIDNQSTNYTYVNGIQISANEEYEIKASDVIKMADEEFTMYVDE